MDAIDVARFWSSIDVRGNSDCWPWMKGTKLGYGEVKIDGRPQLAHRVALSLVIGRIPSGAVVMHSCDNPVCCNPMHLSAGTHLDNVKDRVVKNRSARGVRNGRSKLTEDHVRAIRRDDRTTVAIAAEYGVSPATVSLIQRLKIWKHVQGSDASTVATETTD